jgi:hypothetical protein
MHLIFFTHPARKAAGGMVYDLLGFGWRDAVFGNLVTVPFDPAEVVTHWIYFINNRWRVNGHRSCGPSQLRAWQPVVKVSRKAMRREFEPDSRRRNESSIG